MPDSIPVMLGHRIIAWTLGRSGQGPKMIASSLAQEANGGISVSASGVCAVLKRHGLLAHALRNGLLAGHAAPPEPARDPGQERRIEADRLRRARADRLLLRGKAHGNGRCCLAAHRDRAKRAFIHPGRPQSSGFAERVQRAVLGECRKPAFARYLVPKHTGLRRELERYLEADVEDDENELEDEHA